MDKDLVVKNNDSYSSNEDFNSLNSNSFNHLANRKSNNVDFGSDSSPNFNDDDYSNGNYYQDDYNEFDSKGSVFDDDSENSSDFYSKGSVYKNDFTEDFPDINSQYINKLRADLKQTKKETNVEENKLKNLELNNENSKLFFEKINSDDVIFESGKVLFKAPSFNGISPNYKSFNTSIPILIGAAICFLSLFVFGQQSLFISTFILFVIIIISIINSLIHKFTTTHYLVLDFYLNDFYYETHNLFNKSTEKLFEFDDIVDIGVSYENRETNTGFSYNSSVIKFLLKDQSIFILKESELNSFDEFNYYSIIAESFAYALKKHYFENPQKLKLYKSNDEKEGLKFTTIEDPKVETSSMEIKKPKDDLKPTNILFMKIGTLPGFLIIGLLIYIILSVISSYN